MHIGRSIKGEAWLLAVSCASLCIATGVSCTSSTEPNTPIVPVYIERSLYETELQPLSSPGGMVCLIQPRSSGERLGYGGVLIVRSLVEEQFYAYDLACPYEAPKRTLLEIGDLDAYCPSCSSHYEVLYGSGAPTSGTSLSPLKRYRVQYLSISNQIRVTN